MDCSHALRDYQYGSWCICRACGAWVPLVDIEPVETQPIAKLPFEFNIFPRRPHAYGHAKEQQ